MADAKLVSVYKEKLLYAPDYELPVDATMAQVEAYMEAKGVPSSPPVSTTTGVAPEVSVGVGYPPVPKKSKKGKK